MRRRTVPANNGPASFPGERSTTCERPRRRSEPHDRHQPGHVSPARVHRHREGARHRLLPPEGRAHRGRAGLPRAHSALRRGRGHAADQPLLGAGGGAPGPVPAARRARPGGRRAGRLRLPADELRQRPASSRWSSTAGTAAWAHSWGCRPAWPCARSTCTGPRSRSNAGSRRWRAAKTWARSPSPSRATARIPSHSKRRRAETATSTSSTGPNAGSATARWPTWWCCGRVTPRTCRSRVSWWRRERPATTRARFRARVRCVRCGRPTST